MLKRTFKSLLQQKQICKNVHTIQNRTFISTFASPSIKYAGYNNRTTFDKQQFSTNSEDAAKEEKTETTESTDKAEKSVADLQKEIKTLKDAVLRSYAEEENVRRIAKRDIENAKAYSNSSFAKALLEVADNIDRALESVKKEELNALPEQFKSLKTFYQGIEMTNQTFLKVFEQFKITPYGAINDKFDPSLHDALFSQPDPSKENGAIASVLKKGYKLNDRVIRAAQVGTVNNP